MAYDSSGTASLIAETEKAIEQRGNGRKLREELRDNTPLVVSDPIPLTGLRIARVIVEEGMCAKKAQTGSKAISPARVGEIVMPYGYDTERTRILFDWLTQRVGQREAFVLVQPDDTGNIQFFNINKSGVTRKAGHGSFLEKNQIFIVADGYKTPEGVQLH